MRAFKNSAYLCQILLVDVLFHIIKGNWARRILIVVG